MDISFLIVTRERSKELAFTLDNLLKNIDFNCHEVLVYIDGCPTTESIKFLYPWVKWFGSVQSISASPARNALYKNAIGEILIGLDDDAHPISEKFAQNVVNSFSQNKNVGMITFQEIRGIFHSDIEALKAAKPDERYLTNDFLGCGFAIKKECYFKTNGFPIWIDIYGEETCVALEVLDLGYDILYDGAIKINHRVDKQKRLSLGRNYFRFERQLRNTIAFFLVYYPNPIVKIFKLLFHNFMKYALKDKKYFTLFFKVFFSSILKTFQILKLRKPIKNETIQKRIALKGIIY